MNSSCSKIPDNHFGGCPFKSDYNAFTDHRPRCAVQYQDMINNRLPTSLDYRMYLTQNAESIMKNNTKQAYLKNSCMPCTDKSDWNNGTMLREFDTQKCNTRTCSFRQADPWGLGRHRELYDDEYDRSVEQKFVQMKTQENEWFKTHKNDCGTINDDTMYYPITGIKPDNVQRHAVPSGANLY